MIISLQYSLKTKMSDKELQRKIIQLLKENNSEMELNEVCSLLGITSTELNEVLDNLAGL
jgi:predicted Zn-ribbon and HTH transcriptional regulator|tara:strand:+ start:351 stop:530 length:180 start_codon:yes stop_codon:yes gene_type:complete